MAVLKTARRSTIAGGPLAVWLLVQKLQLLPPGWWVIAAPVATSLWAWSVRVYTQHSEHDGWTDFPVLDRVLVTVTDMVTLAQIGAAARTFLQSNTPSSRPEETAAANSHLCRARETEADEHPNRSPHEALAWYASYFAGRMRQQSVDTFLAVKWWLIPVFLLGEACAACVAALGLGAAPILRPSGVTLLLLAAAATFGVTSMGSYLAARPTALQVSLALLGAVIVAQTAHLWVIGVGFASSTPDLLGRLSGLSFGTAVVVWMLTAYLDPDGRRVCCRVASSATAVLGVVLIGLNAWDRIQVGRIDFNGLANLAWPVGIVAAATLAAVCRTSLNVGVRRAAVAGPPCNRFEGSCNVPSPS